MTATPERVPQPQIAWQISPEGIMPTRATSGSSGYDLYLPYSQGFTLCRADKKLIDIGVRLAIYTPGWEAQIRSRSGLAVKHAAVVINSPGTIDSDYRGTLCVCLVNLGNDNLVLAGGSRIAQLVFAPVAHPEVVEWRDDWTERGEGGFGSTGG